MSIPLYRNVAVKKLDFEQNDAAEKTYNTKAQKYKNTKFDKKILLSYFFVLPLFRVFVVNPFFLGTYKLGCLAMQILLVRFAKKTLILRPCFDIKKASTEKEEAC